MTFDLDQALDLKARGMTLAEIAGFFGVGTTTVWRVLREVGCYHSCKRGRKPKPKPEKKPKRDTSERDAQIEAWVAEGQTLRQVAEKVGITRQAVHAIVRKRIAGKKSDPSPLHPASSKATM